MQEPNIADRLELDYKSQSVGKQNGLPANSKIQLRNSVMRINDLYTFFLWWFLFSIFWILLISHVTVAECLIGGILAFIIAFIPLTMTKLGYFSLRIRGHWFDTFLKIPYKIIFETYLVFVRVITFFIKGKQIRGSFHTLYFKDLHPKISNRKLDLTLLIYTFSIAPNHYIVFIDKKNKKILIHSLVTNR